MRLLLILVTIIIFSCHSKSDNNLEAINFVQLDMSFSNGWDSHFSMIINKNGNFVVGIGHPITNYFKGRLNSQTLKKIDSLTSRVLKIRDSIFIEDKVDQASFAFIYENNDLTKKYFIYGNDAPKQLLIMRKTIFDLVSGINSNKIDTTVTFKSQEDFYRQGPAPKRRNK